MLTVFIVMNYFSAVFYCLKFLAVCNIIDTL